MNRVFLIAEEGRPKELMEQWRTQFLAGMKAYGAIGREFGAVSPMGFPFERPTGFSFPRRNQPEGWIQPQAKGFSRPKVANTADQARIDAIDFPDHPEEMLSREFGLARSVTFERDGQQSTRSLAALRAFGFCWTVRPDGELDNVIVSAPDFAEVLKDPKISCVKWFPEGTGPEIPDGFRRVTEAEVDLIFAEAKVKREKYQAVDREMALMLDVHTPSDLFQAMGAAMSQFGRSLVVDFDCGDTGMAMSMRYESEMLKVHPALEKAMFRIAPHLIKCDAQDWEETTMSSGRILWRHGGDPFLDMDDQENDWSYESYIETDMLADMEFEPEVAEQAPLLVPE